MRFFKDRPDILIPIVWYWTDREDVITWPNAFVSQDWDTIKPVDGCPVGEIGMQPWERKAAWRDGSRPPQANDGPTPCGTPSQWSDGALFADAKINPCQCAGVKGTGRQVQWGEGKFVSPWPLGIGRGDMIERGAGATPDVDQGVGRLIETGTGITPDVDQGVGRLIETGTGNSIGPDLTVGGPPGPHSSGHYVPGLANLNVGWDRGFDFDEGGPSEYVPTLTVGEVPPSFPVTDDCSTFGTAAQYWLVPVSGVSNGSCTNCANVNGDNVLAYAGSCVWVKSLALCTNPTGAWVLSISGADMRLQVAATATHAIYSIPLSSFNPLGSNIFSLVFSDGACSGWPSTITVSPDPGP